PFGIETSRAEIDKAIAKGDVDGAKVGLVELWREKGDLGTAAFVVSRYEQIRECLPLQLCKVAILRSFTIEPLMSLLRTAAFTAGLDLDVQLGGLNTYTDELGKGDSSLYEFAPDVAILALQTCDVAPELWKDYS